MPSVTYAYMRTYQANAPVDITLNMVSKGLASKVFNVLGFNILTALIVGAGMLFFFFPAVYLLIVLSLGAAIIVFENSNPIDAISRSFSLIRGKWWSTFGLVVVMVIINYQSIIIIIHPISSNTTTTTRRSSKYRTREREREAHDTHYTHQKQIESALIATYYYTAD